MNKRELIAEINRVIREIRGRMEGCNFVCHMGKNGYGYAIERMVKRHIGDSCTMDSFLHKKLGAFQSNYVVNEYRILMLENMKKMVQKEYK